MTLVPTGYLTTAVEETIVAPEEFHNSHGGADAGAGTGTSYLCDSNCDMFNLSQ